MLQDSSQLGNMVPHFKREGTKKAATSQIREGATTNTTFLACIMHIIHSFLRVSKSRSETGLSAFSGAAVATFDSSSSHNAALFLRRYYRSCPMAATESAGSERGRPFIASSVRLFSLLSGFWSGFTLTENTVSNESLTTMTEICSVASLLAQCLEPLPEECMRFIELCFSNFPYSSQEAALAFPNSSAEKSSRAIASSLNISLCELILRLPVSSSSAHFSRVTLFLTSSLNKHLDLAQTCAETKAEGLEGLPSGLLERIVKLMGLMLIVCCIEDGNTTNQIISSLQLFNRVVSLPLDGVQLNAAASHAVLTSAVYSCVADWIPKIPSSILSQSEVLLPLLQLLSTIHTSRVGPGYLLERILTASLFIFQTVPLSENAGDFVHRLLAPFCELSSEAEGCLFLRCAPLTQERISHLLHYCPPDLLKSLETLFASARHYDDVAIRNFISSIDRK